MNTLAKLRMAYKRLKVNPTNAKSKSPINETRPLTIDHRNDSQRHKVINTNLKIERWKESSEGKWMKKHCSREYYNTLQELRKSEFCLD